MGNKGYLGQIQNLFQHIGNVFWVAFLGSIKMGTWGYIGQNQTTKLNFF